MGKLFDFFGFNIIESEYGDEPDVEFHWRPFNWLIALLVIIVLWSSWYTVDKEENATVRIFGKYVETVGPGLHFKLPWPISKVNKTVVTKVKRMEIGFRTIEVGPPAKYEDVIEESEMLTGDANIAVVNWIIQYRSYDAYKWQFKVKDPEKLLNFISQASMRLVVGYSPFEKIATHGKAEIQREVKDLMQTLCNEIDFGVKVVAVQLQDVHPPHEVMPAFKDVWSAREDREKFIHEAEAYKNKIIPEARGQAEKMINEAKGYYAKRVNAARGDAAKFLAVWKEYKKNPQITIRRLQYEVAQKVVPGSEVLIDRSGSGLLKLFDVNKQSK